MVDQDNGEPIKVEFNRWRSTLLVSFIALVQWYCWLQCSRPNVAFVTGSIRSMTASVLIVPGCFLLEKVGGKPDIPGTPGGIGGGDDDDADVVCNMDNNMHYT